jgi:hypothetical protein
MLCRVAVVRTDVSHIVFLRRMRLLLVTANVVPNSPILVTLVIKAIRVMTEESQRATSLISLNIIVEMIFNVHTYICNTA